MKARLAELRAQIKLCEEFVTLCDRVKLLEKLQGGLLEAKKLSVESERAEIMTQLQLAAQNLQLLEATMHSSERAIGVLEEEQLRGFIHSARIRLGALHQSSEDATKQIARIDDEMRTGAEELRVLYSKLEELIDQGLNPNTVVAQLETLRREKIELNEAMKAEVTSARSRSDEHQSKKPPQSKAAPLREKDFYPAFIADIAQAKNSVEIVSPYVAPDRAREVMAELTQLVANGVNVMVYTKPTSEQDADSQAEAQNIITDAHRLMITVIQRSAIQYNAAIIDNLVCWEGDINILGANVAQGTMRRTMSSSYVRQLRHYLFSD